VKRELATTSLLRLVEAVQSGRRFAREAMQGTTGHRAMCVRSACPCLEKRTMTGRTWAKFRVV